jgi:mannitol/fructose-specific phosphotransferase system IIA component (Ntr-type)
MAAGPPLPEVEMEFADIFDERLINLNLESTEKTAAFKELAAEISAVKPELDSAELLAVINEREEKMNTSVASGIALPHGYSRGFTGITCAVGFSRKGIEYGAHDKKPVHLVFMLLMGEDSREQYLHVLSRILQFVKSDAMHYMRKAETKREVYDVLCRVG